MVEEASEGGGGRGRGRGRGGRVSWGGGAGGTLQAQSVCRHVDGGCSVGGGGGGGG